MYGVSPPLAAAGVLPALAAGLSSEPHAATPSAKPAVTTANHLLTTITPSPLVTLDRALARHVGVHGDEDHDPENHVLPLLGDRHDLEPVVEHRDDQRADDRP